MRKQLTEICHPKQWKTIAGKDLLPAGFPVYGANGIIGYWKEINHSEEVLTIGCRGTCGAINIIPAMSYVNGNAMCLDDLSNDIDIRYLYYYLKWYDLRKVITGTTIPQITIQGLNKVTVEYPEYNEQMRIVGILDKANAVIIARQQELQKLDELIKARFVEMFGDPVENPMKWDVKQLQEIVASDCTVSYGIVQTGEDQIDGVPVFRPVDIVNRIPKYSELKRTTKEISDKYRRTILKGREMLITVRANIADTCIVGEEFAGCNVGRGIVPIRTQEDVISLEFLKYQIDNKHLNDEIKKFAKGITLIQLNMEDLREVNLIVPPIDKQISFVKMAKQIDKSKFVVQKALVEAQLLFDSLMQKYFG